RQRRRAVRRRRRGRPGRDGGRPRQLGRRHHARARRRRTDERGLRRLPRRCHRPPRHAGVLRRRPHRRRHRQRLRRRLRRGPDAPRVTESTMATRTLAWFHCFSGIAGDMALGSLIDAGADLDEVRGLLQRLPVGGWVLEAVALLRGAPTYGRDVNVELVTPTGAALLAALAVGYGPLPPMTIAATGFGAGSRDLDGLPNTTQVVLGEATSGGLEPGRDDGQPVVLLEVNVDDATGETLAHAVAALLEAGAHDAWVTPIVMKKGRPAHTVSALADPALTGQLSRVLMEETGSLGVRSHTLERWPAARTVDEVDVDGLPVRVKVSEGRVKVEHDDAA